MSFLLGQSPPQKGFAEKGCPGVKPERHGLTERTVPHNGRPGAIGLECFEAAQPPTDDVVHRGRSWFLGWRDDAAFFAVSSRRSLPCAVP